MDKDKKETLRGILIRPDTAEISEVEVPKGEDQLQAIYDLLGVDLITCVAYSEDCRGETVYVDDEGLLKDPHLFFKVPFVEGHQWLAGSGLILGTDFETGESISSALPLERVQREVTFGYAL